MATMGMALAVLDHAETYSDVDGWHAVSDFWSAAEILDELQSLETATGEPLLIDAAAIAPSSPTRGLRARGTERAAPPASGRGLPPRSGEAYSFLPTLQGPRPWLSTLSVIPSSAR